MYRLPKEDAETQQVDSSPVASLLQCPSHSESPQDSAEALMSSMQVSEIEMERDPEVSRCAPGPAEARTLVDGSNPPPFEADLSSRSDEENPPLHQDSEVARGGDLNVFRAAADITEESIHYSTDAATQTEVHGDRQMSDLPETAENRPNTIPDCIMTSGTKPSKPLVTGQPEVSTHQNFNAAPAGGQQEKIGSQSPECQEGLESVESTLETAKNANNGVQNHQDDSSAAYLSQRGLGTSQNVTEALAQGVETEGSPRGSHFPIVKDKHHEVGHSELDKNFGGMAWHQVFGKGNSVDYFHFILSSPSGLCHTVSRTKYTTNLNPLFARHVLNG